MTGAQSRDGRLRRGRNQRKTLSRSELGTLPSRPREFDPVEVLLRAGEDRVASLLPVKYARMAVSPFTFFRGAVSLMTADLASAGHTSVMVQLCGDAHVQNMGSFEAPDARVVFDINDFDETIPGPWEWDVKRMAASLVLAGEDAHCPHPASSKAVEAFLVSYCKWTEELADQPILAAARHQIRRLDKVQAVSAALQQAQRANPCDLLEKYTVTGARGQRFFKKLGTVIWRLRGKEKQAVLDSLALYRESLAPDRLHLFDFFRPVDVAFKVVGTGSVGLRDYVVLMEGNGPADPLLLQIKQEVASVYALYLKDAAPEGHQGRRVTVGQRKIQSQSDLLLGWTRIGEHDYLVRQLNDHKGGIDIAGLTGSGLCSLATVAGELLARGHARSGDALEIKGYLGSWDKGVKSLLHYGMAYAERARGDFQAFQKAISDGRVKIASSKAKSAGTKKL